VRPLFQWRPLGDVQVKGREESVRTYGVDGIAEAYRKPPS
jgi:hypothetical protein